MKTILVDAWNTFVTQEWVNLKMKELLDSFPNKKIILTNANEEEKKKFGIVDMPYPVFSLSHNPDKVENWYYKKMLDFFGLENDELIYFEHNKEACKKAEEIGIKTFYYDKDKKDLLTLLKFLKENL